MFKWLFAENVDFLFQKRNLIDYKPESETGDWKFFNKTLWIREKNYSNTFLILRISAGSTANLLEIFLKFWEIFPINNLTKGRNKRNPVLYSFHRPQTGFKHRQKRFPEKNMWRFLSAWGKVKWRVWTVYAGFVYF